MASKRDQIKMTDAERAAYLDEQRIVNIATIGPSGHPHLVAMWYVMQGESPVFWTFAKSQKVVNIGRDPRITALVESGEGYGELRGVEMRGTARLIDDPAKVLEIGIAVAVKYNGPAGASEQAMPFLEAQAAKRIGIAIDVDHVTSWDHTKLGGGY